LAFYKLAFQSTSGLDDFNCSIFLLAKTILQSKKQIEIQQVTAGFAQTSLVRNEGYSQQLDFCSAGTIQYHFAINHYHPHYFPLTLRL
jgi:hypothetical protein